MLLHWKSATRKSVRRGVFHMITKSQSMIKVSGKKCIFILIFCLFFSTLLSCLWEDPVTGEIKDKSYFAYKQTFDLCFVVSGCPVDQDGLLDIPTSGIVSIDMFPNKRRSLDKGEVHYATLHDNVWIDPFLQGDKEVSVYWAHKRDDYPKWKTMSGAPLKYVTNRKDLFVTIYAGPDGDMDTGTIDIDIIPYREGGLGGIPIYLFFSQVPNVDTVQYDPTNGLISNGDILWVLTKSTTNDLWGPTYYRFLDYEELKKIPR